MSFSSFLENFRRGLIPLDYDTLLAASLSRTGLRYTSDQQCEESLRLLIDSCNNEADLGLTGRIAARQHLLELLETRLRLIDYWQQTPDIQDQAVLPQIFIICVPKSGSTFLHRLMAHDSANRVPWMWEVMFPLPSPPCATNDAGPRIRKARRRLQWLRWTHPALAKAHPIGTFIPQECGAILGYSFESNVFLDMFSIPSYETWVRSRDMESPYEFHLRFLKHLQWQCPAERWVLKSSDHLHAMETVIKTYPGANFVFLHRDPLRVLQEAASQMTLLKSIFSRSTNLSQLGDYETRNLNDKVRKIMEFRDNHGDLEDRIVDVRYLDLASDPVGTVQSIYGRFGLSLSNETKARMKAFAAFAAAEHNKMKKSDSLSLADFDLGPEQKSQPFDLYCERFHIKREPL